jgi:hypothetical protein
MANAVDDFDRNPERGEGRSRGPVATDRPGETPEPKGDEAHIDDQEPELAIGRDQSSQEAGRRK